MYKQTHLDNAGGDNRTERSSVEGGGGDGGSLPLVTRHGTGKSLL